MKKIKKSVGKSVKDVTKQAARQIAAEPLEVLKTAKRQVVETERVSGKRQETRSEEQALLPDLAEAPSEEVIKVKTERLLRALEAEIEDIKRQREQREAERAKEEHQQLTEKEGEKKPLVEPSAKPSRKMLGGIKGRIENLKRRMEIRKPPSG